MKYKVLYADPPWQYRSKRTGGSMRSGSAQKYPTLSLDEICTLPIKRVMDKDSVLFLWATVPMLPEALEVMKAWGYRYTTKITWHKTGRMGLGYWFRGEVEELLFGVRGKVKAFRCQLPNFIEAPVGKHSEKPEYFRTLIETATKNFVGSLTQGEAALVPYLELFAREGTEGWAQIGLDVDGVDVRKALQGGV